MEHEDDKDNSNFFLQTDKQDRTSECVQRRGKIRRDVFMAAGLLFHYLSPMLGIRKVNKGSPSLLG